jgi:hypothetical protein
LSRAGVLRLDYECSGFTAVQIAHVDLATAVVDWGQSYADASAIRRQANELSAVLEDGQTIAELNR